jgi:hypothetical protein
VYSYAKGRRRCPINGRPSPIQGVRAPRDTKVDADVTGGYFIPADRGITVNREMQKRALAECPLLGLSGRGR